jgi:Tfp pilus assembly PilM family ATPase
MNLRRLTRQPVLSVAFVEGEVRWTFGAHGKVASSGRAPLAAGLLDDGVITDPEAAGVALRSSPGFGGSRRMQTVVGLPAQRSVFRQLELPVLSKKQFADMAEHEIRREMPMLADNAYVSWSRTGERDGNVTVFVVGVARDVLDSHIAAAQHAGLVPVSADLCVIAAARAVGSPDCIIACVEDTSVEICVMLGGVPAIVRHVTMAQPSDAPGWSEQLGEELARTLKFYRDSHRDDTSLDNIPISFVGSAAGKALLGGQIGAATAHELVLPPLQARITPEQDASRYVANVGLSMKSLAA